jgi:hypothetical protein
VVATFPPNVSGADLTAKQDAFYLYDTSDSQLMCYTEQLRAKNSECADYAQWLTRQYRVRTGPGWDEPCLVPQLAGFPAWFGFAPASEDAAIAQIRAQGGWPGKVSHEYDDFVPEGFVVSQDPNDPPAFLPQGTKVSITVSKGPEPEPKQKQERKPELKEECGPFVLNTGFGGEAASVARHHP